MINIRAQVDVVLPIKKTIPFKGMPLNMGALEIFSEDRERKFIVDLNYSDSNSDRGAGEQIVIYGECDIDLEVFEMDELCPYNLTIEDLETGKCTAEFYCSDVDCEEEYFDYENAQATATIINNDNEKMYTLNLTLER
jgi:hypothetical protein